MSLQFVEALLEPQGPFVTPLKGDTLFGHLCWQLVDNPGLLSKGDFQSDWKPNIVLRSESQGHLSPQQISAAADAACRLSRKVCSARRLSTLHVFCAAPVAFAVLLGHRLTALGGADLQLYEFDDAEQTYCPSLLLTWRMS